MDNKEIDDYLDNESGDDRKNKDLYCLVCDKLFNSIKAKENHELSKKHKKQFESLKQILLEEDLKFQSDLVELLESKDELDEDDCDDDGSFELINKNQIGDVKLTKRAKRFQRKQKRDLANREEVSNDLEPIRSDEKFNLNINEEDKSESNIVNETSKLFLNYIS